MYENAYQRHIRAEIERIFPNCMIIKNNANLRQGIPDLLVLVGDRWAMLEVKRSHDADERPNQRWYVNMLNQMSFAAFVFPENEKEVLDALQLALQPRRSARVPKS